MRPSFGMKLLIGLSFLLSRPAPAQTVPPADPAFRPAPGNLGPNAFTGWVWRVRDARIDEDRIVADLSYRHVRDRFGTGTHTGAVRVEIPFSALASVEVQYLVEYWKLNHPGMEALQPTRPAGFSPGDVAIGMKVRVLEENEAGLRPAVTARASIKTASGSFEDRRFTDSSGYSIDVLLAKGVLIRSGALRKIRVLGEAGFMVWDDSAHSQNDAFRYGAAVELEFRRPWTATVGYHGFNGWRGKGDRPATLYVEGRRELNRKFTAFSSVDVGMSRSANPLTLSGGIRLSIPRKSPQRRMLPTHF